MGDLEETILSATSDALIGCDEAGTIVAVNGAAEALVGTSGLLGTSLYALLPERLHTVGGGTFLDHVAARAKELGGRPIRIALRRRDGLELRVEMTVGTLGHRSAARIALSFRRPAEDLAIVDEPLERLAGEPRMRGGASLGAADGDSEIYRIVFERAPVGIFHFDATTAITACNEPFVELVGASRRFLVGVRLSTVTDPAIRGAVREVLGGARVHWEGVYRSMLSGRSAEVAVDMAPVRGPSGEVVGGVAIVQEIGERRRLESQRNEALAQLETVLRSAPIGLALLDRDARYVVVNDTLAAINRRPIEATIGRTVREVVPEFADEIEARMRQVLETGEPVVTELDGRRIPGDPRGRRRHWHVSYYPVRSGTELRGLGIAVVDLTARQLADEERARLYREAQQAIRVRDDFLSIASHELKTPLTPLSMRLQAMRRTLSRGGAVDPREIDKALRSVERLTTLIHDLLDAARVAAGRLALNAETTAIVAYCEEILATLRREGDAHPIVLATEIDDGEEGELAVEIDRARFAQVLTNLVDNARKYSPAGGPIEVSIAASEERVTISVRDRGIGIPKGERAHVFDRYYRARNAAIQSFGGLGLGLFICRDIVERSGGRIWVESEPGQGSTFFVELPRAHGRPPNERPSVPPRASSMPSRPSVH